MKLLLTSEGFTNEALQREFLQLLGKDPSESDILVIPTAAMIFDDDKRWAIDHMYSLAHMFPWKRFRVCDVASFSSAEVAAQVKTADVVYVMGGSEYYLTTKLRAAGFGELLPEILEDKLYVGVSAGSIILGKTIPFETIDAIYGEGCPEQYTHTSFFELFDFSIIAHYGGSQNFENTKEANLAPLLSGLCQEVYAISNGVGIKVVDGLVEVVGQGAWKKFAV